MNVFKRITILVLAVCFLLVLPNHHGAAYAVTPTSAPLNWSINKEIQATHLRDVVKNKQATYVAVGDDGAIFSSTNLEDWTRKASPTLGDFYAVTTNGSKFVAVGSHGAIITSNDGHSWSSSSIHINVKEGELVEADFRSKNYKGNPNRSLTSADVVLNDVIWNGSKFIAVGTLNTKVKFYDQGYFSTIGRAMLLTSLDGVKWSTTTLKDIYGPGFKILYANNQYYIFFGARDDAGENNYTGVFVSKDLVKWTRPTWMFDNKKYDSVKGYTITDIAYNGKMFVATTGVQSHIIPEDNLKAHIYTSTNGIQWTESKNRGISAADGVTPADTLTKSISSLNQLYWDGKQFLAINSHTNAIYGLNFGQDKILYYGSIQPGVNNKSVYWDGSTAIAVGEFGSIYTSIDPKSWTGRKEPIASNLNSVAYANGRYVAVGNMNSIIESRDGLQWNSYQNKDAFFANGAKEINYDVIASDNGFWIMNRYTSCFMCNEQLRYSSQAGQYKVIDMPSGSFKDYAIMNNAFVGSKPKNEIWKINLESANNNDAASLAQDTTNKYPYQQILTNGKTQLGIPFKAEKDMYYKDVYTYEVSTDGGQSWKKTSYQGKNEATISAFGKYIDFNYDQLYTSTDGSKWTKGNLLGKEEDKINVKKVTSIATNGKLILATSDLTESSKSENYGNTALWMSMNGSNWTIVKLPTKSSLRKVIWDGSKFIIVGDGATVLTGIPSN
ncbi:hypothetical protein [Paenibacillus guangzhouensis]|uniref:hypothetical protein n=1 Tax=Paenibacillus guangzhouensis TaxID=1473112 RepID=UPI001266E1CC|nr:hypothetical protein [Paenibacillus guangzhouensis]